MANLKDIFTQLKSVIVGTKTTKIDNTLNSAVADISKYKSNSGRIGYIELINKLLSQGDFKFAESLYGSSQTMNPTMIGQQQRLSRYRTYESIVSCITYCHRALNVLVDNILSPDDITKTSLDIKPKTFLEDEQITGQKIDKIRNIIETLKIENSLDLIVKNTLKFGDFFIEISNSRDALISRSFLVEQYRSEEFGSLHNDLHSSFEVDNFKFSLDFSLLEDNTSIKNPTEKLKNTKLVFHHPRNVVKLQSEVFPVCLGYLVFPKYALNPQQLMNDQLINNICTQILKNIEQKVPEIGEIGNLEKDDLRSILRQMVYESDTNKVLNVRFVTTDKMQHFVIPSTKFYPYGESIFESVSFLAKVLIALETALTISRLNRSTEKRKILIETGLSRDATNAIERFKEQFKKRKIALDDLTVDTVPSAITTFEDIYIPQKDGKPFVDIQTFTEGNIDVRNKTDELKFMRDSLVASLGIPASFLNIEENLSNKSALGEESILFARTIVNHQKYFTAQINDLIQKIVDIIDPEESMNILENVLVAFQTPKSLQFERQSKYIGDLVNLIESLERIGIPKEYSKKKYLSDIDWEDVESYMTSEKIDKSLNVTKDEDTMGGGFTGGGMGGY
ncbi:MAG: hypothetical protein BWY04_00501 [candidate division CPR1 bacterium ADurb.Bin160]|uniref:Portal protein n=1 Tax=candidate division CPR1 bacterium ADurb.Bin160 TaxID=1852826 RepID=A0A1V5ZP56_9BACT|nr:MAG: hypothetical protein BWY04_00501 [candidate division CPR1 bacterium ADurb.Bin160]